MTHRDTPTARYLVGDVFERMSELEDGSVDLIMTSPPFLALRSYLPADHPDKAKEIGSEATPAEYIDTLLRLTAEWGRLLAPHGSICVELGDTYSGGGGGDARKKSAQRDGWPLDKSLCGIPTLYAWSLAYGRNLLTGEPSPAGKWRVRNLVAWCLDTDTTVYARTPTGDRPMRLLHLHQQFAPGKFQLWDGQRWTPVIGTSTSTADDAIEIEFRNGERVACTREHEWPTSRGVLRADALVVGDVVPSVRLPEPDDARRPGLVPDEIGWLIGLFLADGSFDGRDRIQIAHHADAETDAARLRAIAADYDGTAGTYRYDGNEAVTVLRSKALAGIIRRYIAGDNARNKHLDPACWGRTDEFLRAVLDGYLDGDGHYDAKNDRWRLTFTDNPWLARDLRTLGARLGVMVRLARRRKRQQPDHPVQGEPFCYRGEVRFGYKVSKHSRPKEPGEIVAIRASKRRSFIDVGVEGEPHLFALASGLLTHNCRPNPAVGFLGDKFRPATSYLTIATRARDRYFDLDAVRTELKPGSEKPGGMPRGRLGGGDGKSWREGQKTLNRGSNPAGAPPLDWWCISPGGYEGAHYAVYPPELCVRPIEAMCPRRVCTTCGQPSRRITEATPEYAEKLGSSIARRIGKSKASGYRGSTQPEGDHIVAAQRTTVGWSDCGHGTWRPGHVLDPFAGSGTTLAVAVGHGRAATGIDIDARNADLARERIGMFLTIDDPRTEVTS